jgi:hypothetical protein
MKTRAKRPENRLEPGFKAACGFASVNFDCSSIKPEGIHAFFNILLEFRASPSGAPVTTSVKSYRRSGGQHF